MKSTETSTKSRKKKSTQKIYGLYGARISESGKYVNLSVVSGEFDEDSGVDSRKWGTVIVKKKGKYIKVKVSSTAVTLTIPRLDAEDEDEDDEDDSDVLDGKKLVNTEDLPF